MIRNWPGRIRTYAWRVQSPLPYRLATGQCFKFYYIELNKKTKIQNPWERLGKAFFKLFLILYDSVVIQTYVFKSEKFEVLSGDASFIKLFFAGKLNFLNFNLLVFTDDFYLFIS